VSLIVVNVAVADIGLVLPFSPTGGALNETPAGADPVYSRVNETSARPSSFHVNAMGKLALPAVPSVREPI
jgi:hypothetical protein